MLAGACLCGRVTLELPRAPDRINICNCRLCRASGAAWGYYDAGEIVVTGMTQSYVRDDLEDTWLALRFCPNCGSTTHYVATPEHPSERVGVNTRLFAQDMLAGVPVKWQDGRAVEVETDDFIITGTGHVGDGKAF